MAGIPENILKVEETVRGEVSPENLKLHVDHLCSLGEKLAGTQEEVKACGYIVDRLKEAGVEAQVHEFESYVSHPLSASFRVDFPSKLEVEGVGVSFGISTPEAGLSAEVVHVGAGNEEDYFGLDVKGKIVLVDKLPSPQRGVNAAKFGAAAMVAMSEGMMKHKMIVTPVWGNPSLAEKNRIPRIPVVSISGDDGAALKELAKSGQLRGTVRTDNFEGWRTLRIPVAEIKGTEPEFLLVGGHYCSWFDGATDNATGNSCMIELAKLLQKNRSALRYGVRLAWWPGHSHGRYSGSTWYADAFWQELFDRGIVYFNIDSPGVKGATVYVPRHQMAEISDFNEGCVAELTDWSTVKTREAQLALGRRTGKYINTTRPSRAADQSFWGIGLTSLGVYSMLPPDHPDRRQDVGGSGGAWWWHSIDDTADKADPAILAQDTRLYLSIILRMAGAEVLPFDFRPAVQDYLDALKEYQEEAGQWLPLAELIRDAEALMVKAEALKTRSEETGGSGSREINRFFLRLARVLNPCLYTEVQPWDQQPALATRLLPDLTLSLELKRMDPGSSDFKFLRTQLSRKVSKIRHYVLEAGRMIEAYLG